MTTLDPPDPSKRRLLGEVLVVLLVVWLPFFVGSLNYRASPWPRTLASDALGWVQDAGAVVLILYLLRLAREPLRHVGIRPTGAGRELFWGFTLYVAVWVMFFILDHWGLPGEAPLVVQPKPTGLYAALNPLFILTAAAMEELLFRGYLSDRFRRLTGSRAWGFLLTNVLFTAYHPYGWSGLVDIFLFGALLSLFYAWGRSLPRLVLAHAAYNMALAFEWWRI